MPRDDTEELNPFLSDASDERGIQLGSPFPTVQQASAIQRAKAEQYAKSTQRRSCLLCSPGFCSIVLLSLSVAAAIIHFTIGFAAFVRVIGNQVKNSPLAPYIAGDSPGASSGDAVSFTLYREGYSPLPYFPASVTGSALTYTFLSDFAGIVEPSTVTHLKVLGTDTTAATGTDGTGTEYYYVFSVCPLSASLLQKIAHSVSSQCYTGRTSGPPSADSTGSTDGGSGRRVLRGGVHRMASSTSSSSGSGGDGESPLLAGRDEGVKIACQPFDQFTVTVTKRVVGTDAVAGKTVAKVRMRVTATPFAAVVTNRAPNLFFLFSSLPRLCACTSGGRCGNCRRATSRGPWRCTHAGPI